jgi:hypothetical protein
MDHAVDARKIRIALFGALTVLGTVGTLNYNVQFLLAGGFSSPTAFVEAAMVNAASSSVAVDIAVSATAGMLFMVFEGRRVGVRHIWAYVVLSVFLAFAATFPAFLLARELRLAARERASAGDPSPAPAA